MRTGAVKIFSVMGFVERAKMNVIAPSTTGAALAQACCVEREG